MKALWRGWLSFGPRNGSGYGSGSVVSQAGRGRHSKTGSVSGRRSMSERRNWWSDGIRKGWLGRYESELVYFLREKTGRLTNDEQLVLVVLSLLLKSGHTTLPLGISPKKWGEVVGVPPESIALLLGNEIHAGDLLNSEKIASSTPEPFNTLVANPP